ncbi:MAG: DNA polymerase III subunit delta' [Pseudohongiellaceae bacterium]
MSNYDHLLSQVPFPWQESHWRRLDRLRINNQLAHAYLIAGSAGLGLRVFAEKFAHLLLCAQPEAGRACAECKQCVLSANNQHPDLLRVRPEGTSRVVKVEQIREASEFLSMTSHAGGPKIVIIEQSHQMNASAANALLKTLEEPNPDSYLLLVTESISSMMATIRSRCQRLQFEAPRFDESLEWLQGQLLDNEDGVKLLVAADNQPLKALELASSDAYEVQQSFIANVCDLLTGHSSIRQCVTQAAKLGEPVAVGYLLNLAALLVKSAVTGATVITAEDPRVSRLIRALDQAEHSSKAQAEGLLRFYQSALDGRQQLASSTNLNPQLIMESLLRQWARLPLGLRT